MKRSLGAILNAPRPRSGAARGGPCTALYGTLLTVLLLGLTGRASADSLTFGHWLVATSTDGSYSYAATVNGQGEVFGEFCTYKSASCRWLLAVRTRCRFGDVYPILANSSRGANPVAIFCVGAVGDRVYGMALMNREKLEQSIAHAAQVGFAVPLGDGGFTVARFQLSGRVQATSFLQKSFFAEIQRRHLARAAAQPL